MAAEAEVMRRQNAPKRKLEPAGFHDSTFSKLRSVVRDLRPHFYEVVQAPDFRGCKAIHDIQKKLKLMIDLSNQLRVETISHSNECKHAETEQKNDTSQSFEKPNTSEIPSENPHQVSEPGKPSNSLSSVAEMPQASVMEIKGADQELACSEGRYIVGGSPIGWNFLVSPMSKPVYYGVTKETWLSKLQPMSQTRASSPHPKESTKTADESHDVN